VSIHTAEIKALVVNELGAGFEDLLEDAKSEIFRWEGSKRAFKQGADAVTGLLAHIQKDVDEEEVEVEYVAYAQKYVTRAIEALRNLRLKAEAMELKQRGKVDGLQQVVDATKKIHDKSMAHAENLRAVEAAVEAGDEEALLEFQGRNRIRGTHPGPSLRHKREAETEASETTTSEINGNGSASDNSTKPGRKCGNCRKPGHTARNCEEKKATKKAKKKKKASKTAKKPDEEPPKE
jgi:hypothetical protein